MGLGMLVVVAAEDVARAQAVLPEYVHLVGEVVHGQGKVMIENL
jgi:hypothetical protein